MNTLSLQQTKRIDYVVLLRGAHRSDECTTITTRTEPDLESGGDVKVLLHVSSQHLADRAVAHRAAVTGECFVPLRVVQSVSADVTKQVWVF